MVQIVVEFILTVVFLAGLVALVLVKWRYESFKDIDLTADTQKKYPLKLVYFADECEVKYIPPGYVSVVHNRGSVIFGIIGLACIGYVIYFILANSFKEFEGSVIYFFTYSGPRNYYFLIVSYFVIFCGLIFYGLFFVSGLIIRLLYGKYLVAPDVTKAFFGSGGKK